jgi:hypothetical protein
MVRSTSRAFDTCPCARRPPPAGGFGEGAVCSLGKPGTDSEFPVKAPESHVRPQFAAYVLCAGSGARISRESVYEEDLVREDENRQFAACVGGGASGGVCSLGKPRGQTANFRQKAREIHVSPQVCGFAGLRRYFSGVDCAFIQLSRFVSRRNMFRIIRFGPISSSGSGSFCARGSSGPTCTKYQSRARFITL